MSSALFLKLLILLQTMTHAQDGLRYRKVTRHAPYSTLTRRQRHPQLYGYIDVTPLTGASSRPIRTPRRQTQTQALSTPHECAPPLPRSATPWQEDPEDTRPQTPPILAPFRRDPFDCVFDRRPSFKSSVNRDQPRRRVAASCSPNRHFRAKAGPNPVSVPVQPPEGCPF
jgi:hypothetical protein